MKMNSSVSFECIFEFPVDYSIPGHEYGLRGGYEVCTRGVRRAYEVLKLGPDLHAGFLFSRFLILKTGPVVCWVFLM
jgi:hypothetical protein